MRNSQSAVIVHPTQLVPVLPAASQPRAAQAGVIVTPEQAIEPAPPQLPPPTLVQSPQVGSPASAFAVPWHAVVPVLSSGSGIQGGLPSPNNNDMQDSENGEPDVLPNPGDDDDDDDVFEPENGDSSGGMEIGKVPSAPQRRTQSMSALHGREAKVSFKIYF